MQPNLPYFEQEVTYMENEAGESIKSVPHAQMTFKMPVKKPVCRGAMLRIKRR